MNPADRRLWLDLTTARYLEAVERGDFDAQEQLWAAAARDPELEAAFHEIHQALIEDELGRTATAVADAVTKHLPAATIVRGPAGPVTFADAAEELFRDPPGGLAAHAITDALRASREPLPADLGLSKLVEFAEAKFGPAPRDYWRAFRAAALTVRMRANSATEYQLAARRAPEPEDRP